MRARIGERGCVARSAVAASLAEGPRPEEQRATTRAPSRSSTRTPCGKRRWCSAASRSAPPESRGRRGGGPRRGLSRGAIGQGRRGGRGGRGRRERERGGRRSYGRRLGRRRDAHGDHDRRRGGQRVAGRGLDRSLAARRRRLDVEREAPGAAGRALDAAARAHRRGPGEARGDALLEVGAARAPAWRVPGDVDPVARRERGRARRHEHRREEGGNA